MSSLNVTWANSTLHLKIVVMRHLLLLLFVPILIISCQKEKAAAPVLTENPAPAAPCKIAYIKRLSGQNWVGEEIRYDSLGPTEVLYFESGGYLGSGLKFVYLNPNSYKVYDLNHGSDTTNKPYYWIKKDNEGRLIEKNRYPVGEGTTYTYNINDSVYAATSGGDTTVYYFNAAGNITYSRTVDRTIVGFDIVYEYFYLYGNRPNPFKGLYYNNWDFYAHNNNNLERATFKSNGITQNVVDYINSYDINGRLTAITISDPRLPDLQLGYICP